MWLNGFRLLVLISLAWAGWQFLPVASQPPAGALIGLAFGAAIIALELRLHRVPAHSMVGALVGGVTGLLGAHLVWGALSGLRDSLGWYAEFRIPFSTLRYGGGNLQTWGLNVARSIRRRNEDSYWSPIPRQFSITRLSLAGELQDLPVPARRTATMTPYGLAATSRDYQTQSEYDARADVGVDAKLGLTPSLTLDLTYNTDFAQVEVDEQRINLTRFPLLPGEAPLLPRERRGVFPRDAAGGGALLQGGSASTPTGSRCRSSEAAGSRAT